MAADPRSDAALRDRLAMYLEDRNVNESYKSEQLRIDVNDIDPGMPSSSAFRRFLSTGTCTETVRRGTISFLKSVGYWPEVNDMEKIYPLIADFFGASKVLEDDDVNAYLGNFLYYQHSTRHPGKIATSALRIRRENPNVTNPPYLCVEEVSTDMDFEEAFKGIYFRNKGKDIICMRQESIGQRDGSRGPKLLLPIDMGVSKEGLKKNKSWIAGRLLKTSTNDFHQHQCNWFMREASAIEVEGRALTEDEVKAEDETAHHMLFEKIFLRGL